MSTTPRRLPRLAAPLASGLALTTLAALSGCYEHVVGARGLGASTYDIHESYQENSKVDDWLFGKRDNTSTGTKIVRPQPATE